MCSIFSVCFTRFSVVMMSMISCNLLLAPFGASSSTVRFRPLGVLSNGITVPASIFYANAQFGPRQTHCPCCVTGLTAIRGLRNSACRDSMVIGLPFCIFGHKQTSTLIPHDRLVRCRVRYSSFSIPVRSVPSCCWMPCRTSASDLTPTAWPTDSINLSRTQLCRQFLLQNVVTTRHLVLDPIAVPSSFVPTFVRNFVTTLQFFVQNSVIPIFGDCP